MRERFWEAFSLDELTEQEWEALCDGCGRCCLVKLQDDDTDEVFFTSLACQQLDCETVRCRNYATRFQQQSDCIRVTPQLARQQGDWLPSSCAYRLLAEGRSLPEWHPLLSGRRDSVTTAGFSVAGRVKPETLVPEERQQEFIVRWVD